MAFGPPPARGRSEFGVLFQEGSVSLGCSPGLGWRRRGEEQSLEPSDPREKAAVRPRLPQSPRLRKAARAQAGWHKSALCGFVWSG